MSDTRTPEEIRRDIEATREELADTAAALAEKADVKARAQEKVDETKAKMSHKLEETRANPPRNGILVAAGVAGVLVAVIVLRRRGE